MTTPVTRREQVLITMRGKPSGHRFHLRDIAKETGMDTNNVSMTLSKLRSVNALIMSHGEGYWSLGPELSREQAAAIMDDSITAGTPLKVVEPEQAESPELVFHGEDCPGHTTGLPGESCLAEAAHAEQAEQAEPEEKPSRRGALLIALGFQLGASSVRYHRDELPDLVPVGVDQEDNRIVIDNDNGHVYRLVAL